MSVSLDYSRRNTVEGNEKGRLMDKMLLEIDREFQTSHLTEQDPHFFHTNDIGLGGNILELPQLAKRNIEGKEPDKIKVALIVGTGGVFSMISEIPADVILIADYDIALKNWLESCIAALKSQPSPGEFERVVYGDSANNFELVKEKFCMHAEPFVGETSIHFLDSQARYDLARAAIQKKVLQFCPLDLTEESSVKRLSKILNKHHAVISFANLTNIHEHITIKRKGGTFDKNLRNLPFMDGAIFFASGIMRMRDSVYPPAVGIDNYLYTIST